MVRSVSVGAVIPVRTASSRLPGKALSDVSGKLALERVLDLVRRASTVCDVTVATTNSADDDTLAEMAVGFGARVYRGPVMDVLRRIAEAARAGHYEIVVEVDGDDLLCSPEYMDLGVSLLQSQEADWVSFTGLPVGGTPNVLTTTALERAVQAKEHVDTATGFYRSLIEDGGFRIVKVDAVDPAHRHLTARLTLDYPEDLEFFRAVYEELGPRPAWSFADLIELLHARPDLVAINSLCTERYDAHFSQETLGRGPR